MPNDDTHHVRRRLLASLVSGGILFAASAAHAQDAVPPPGGGEPPPTPTQPQPQPQPQPTTPAPPPPAADPQPLPPSNERGSDVEYPLAQEPSTEEHARIDNSPVAHDGHPLAGYQNGLFYLRDHHDDFNLYIQGRMQLDWYSFFGPGVADTTLKPTLFIRRLRSEVTGDFLKHWRFQIGGDFGATAIDNPKGTNQSAAASPGTAPSGTSARYAAAQSTRFQAAPTDAFISWRPATNIFNVQVGQFDAPFTMENRTPDKYIQFMERSLAVRDVGIPTNKEVGAMFWGETADRFVFYSLGPFLGDGQNRPNVDARMDVIGRAFVHPFANASFVKRDDPLRDVQIGGSFRYGSRDKRWVDYDYTTMTTQGAYTFWSPIYTGSNGVVHVIPSGDQIYAAGELRIPVQRFDVTSEVVYINHDTREAIEGYQSSNSERFGTMKGASYYVELGWWPIGKRDINGVPGYENPPHVDFSRLDPPHAAQAVQLLAKWEQLSLSYASASRAGTPDAKNIDGDIKVNALSFGVNYWATKHVRISLNYVLDYFPSSAAGKEQTPDNRALAPGNTLPLGAEHGAREGAHTLNELLARFAIAL